MISTIRHPDNLFCPICGCGSIFDWPDLDKWDSFTDEEKSKFENCPCCGYGWQDDFPYEDFE